MPINYIFFKCEEIGLSYIIIGGISIMVLSGEEKRGIFPPPQTLHELMLIQYAEDITEIILFFCFIGQP